MKALSTVTGLVVRPSPIFYFAIRLPALTSVTLYCAVLCFVQSLTERVAAIVCNESLFAEVQIVCL